MTDKEAEKPWPLVATHMIADIEAENIYSADALLESAISQLHLVTRKSLEEAGRLRDVRTVMLLCYGAEQTGPPPHYLFNGITVDKKQFKIVLEDETENSVRLKLVKIQTGEEK